LHAVLGTEEQLRVLVRNLSAYRYTVGAESSFHAGVELVLQECTVSYIHEFDLGRAFGRIDFYLPDSGTGLELKIKGSPSDVARQLYRYCLSPNIASLILLTPRHRLARMPETMNGKPLLSVSLSWGNF
jgi:hypothetical protein